MKVLVVVDMQNDFISGPLGSEEAKRIVDKVRNKIDEFHGDRIFLTQDTHGKNYMETQEGRLLPVEHCIYNTLGWVIDSSIHLAVNRAYTRGIRNEITTKNTFGSKDLVSKMCALSRDEDESINEIVLVGLCTDICVISNAMLLKAFFPEARITVDAACCAGVTPESHRNALAAMKMCQINIENWEE